MTVFILMAIYAIVFSLIALFRYHSFSFHDIDLAVINQIFWNTVHGNLIVENMGSATILNGGHVFLIALVLGPVYWLYQSPLTLLILQTVALALGAWSLFLIARNLVDEKPALVISFCYLIYPALNYVNLFEFHPIAFSTPLLLFMFLFYQRKRWWLFLLFMFLALICREDVAIPVFAFGVFATIMALRTPREERKKAWKWGLVPLCSGLFWFIFCVKFLQPHFRLPELKTATGESGMLSFYGWLGQTPGEILRTLLLRPGYVLKGIFIRPKLIYLRDLFLPTAFFSFLSPPHLVMVLISSVEGLLSQRFTHFSIRYQYSSIITPFVFVSAVYGLRNLLRWKMLSGKKYIPALLILGCSIYSAAAFGPLVNLPSGFKMWRLAEEDSARRKLIEEIPESAPVIATFEFTPKLSSRPRLFYWYHVYTVSRRPEFAPNVEAAQNNCLYALVDFDDWLTFYDFYTPRGYRQIYQFLTDGDWELVSTINSLALFKKGEETELGVVDIVSRAEEETSQSIPGLSQLGFAGFSAEEEESLGYPVIKLSVDLECRGGIKDDLLLLARFVSRAEPGRGFQQFFFAPYRIYPNSRWKPGDIVRQKCGLLVPENSPPGAYDLILTLIRKRPNLPLSPEARNLFYNYYDTAMALKYLPARWGISPEQLLEQIIITRVPSAVVIGK